MKNLLTISLLASFIFLSLVSISQVTEGEIELYKAMLEQDRNLKNESFKNPEASPIIVADIVKFKGLSYFEPDIKYKVKAQITMLEEQVPVALSTSDGGKMDLIKYGTLTFQLDEKTYTLSIFRDQNLPELSGSPGQYFIPFTDKTTGETSYDNGRYIVIPKPQGSAEIELDFNRTFNPYSAYNSDYNSIIPPEENGLDATMAVGERKYEDR